MYRSVQGQTSRVESQKSQKAMLALYCSLPRAGSAGFPSASATTISAAMFVSVVMRADQYFAHVDWFKCRCLKPISRRFTGSLAQVHDSNPRVHRHSGIVHVHLILYIYRYVHV